MTSSTHESAPRIPEEVALTDTLTRIFQGEQVDIRAGKWRVFNPVAPNLLQLDYGREEAEYYFAIGSNDTDITLLNIHRRAARGTGTLSLQLLEQSLKSVVRRAQKEIRVIFPTVGQTDTAHWLTKNGYHQIKQEGDTVFLKHFSIPR